MQLKNDVAVINAIVGGKRPSYPFTAESGSSHFTTEQRLWRLMQVCWHMKPAVRPSMRNVKACLKMIMHNTTDTPTEVKDVSLILASFRVLRSQHCHDGVDYERKISANPQVRHVQRDVYV